jgi:hypothetical protein
MRRSSRRIPRCRSLAAGALLLLLSGCSFLASEFGWLDRPAPDALRSPDAPPTGTAQRP